MSKKKGHGEEHEEEMGEGWLLPYADLLTLLLALFIVLFASSSIDQAKFAAMASAFTNEILGGASFESIGDYTDMDVLPQLEISPAPDADSDSQELVDSGAMSEDDMSELQSLQTQLAQYFEDNGLTASVSMTIDERGLVISLSNAVLFDSGQAEVKEQYKSVLVSVSDSVSKLDRYIRVEGHTDNVPMGPSVAYPTNWELSVARACSVVRLFIDLGGSDPQRLVACGYGEYKPVADNSTVEGRAKNRRIDIIVLNTKFNSLEDANAAAASGETTD